LDQGQAIGGFTQSKLSATQPKESATSDDVTLQQVIEPSFCMIFPKMARETINLKKNAKTKAPSVLLM
jgi:hypothetical protein